MFQSKEYLVLQWIFGIVIKERFHRKKILKATQGGTEFNCLGNGHGYGEILFFFSDICVCLFRQSYLQRLFFFLTNNLKHSYQSFLEKSLQLPQSIQQEVVKFPHGEQFALGPWKEWGEGERGNVSPSNSFSVKLWVYWMGRVIKKTQASLFDTRIQAIWNFHQCLVEKENLQ